MLKLKHRFALFFYNYTAILAFKYKDGSFKTSKLLILQNLVKIPLSMALAGFVALYPPLRDAIFIKKVIVLKNYSDFSRLSVLLVIAIMDTASYLLCILQILQVKKIKNFMNSLILLKIERTFLEKFHKKCVKRFIDLILVFSFVSAVQIIGAMKFSALAILADFIFLFPNFVLIGFISFFINIENFISVMLLEFKCYLESMEARSFSTNNYLKLTKRHHEIHAIFKQFNNCFGIQLNLVVCYVTSMMVLNVKIITVDI